jgi:hypothetical protein
MRYQDALIAWNPDSDQIRIDGLIYPDANGVYYDWTDHPIAYMNTGGAAYTAVRALSDGPKLDRRLMREFREIVKQFKVKREAAHREFLKIDQYRALVGGVGFI